MPEENQAPMAGCHCLSGLRKPETVRLYRPGSGIHLAKHAAFALPHLNRPRDVCTPQTLFFKSVVLSGTVSPPSHLVPQRENCVTSIIYTFPFVDLFCFLCPRAGSYADLPLSASPVATSRRSPHIYQAFHSGWVQPGGFSAVAHAQAAFQHLLL